MQVTRNLAINGHRQFFVITRYADGSADQTGPFAAGEDAAAEIAEQERIDAEIEQAEGQAWADDMAQMRWAEAGGYAAGLARPGRIYPRTDGISPASSGLDDDCEIPF